MLSGISFDETEEVDEQVFNKAMKNMESFAVVGLTEHFTETLALFYLKLGWPRIPAILHMNTGTEKDTISESDRSAIAKRDRFDVRLFDLIKLRFGQELVKFRKEIDHILPTINNSSRDRILSLKARRFWKYRIKSR
jgi:hypothetical protein